MIVATSLNYLSCQYAPPCSAEEGVLTPLKTEYHYLWSWLSEQRVIYCSCRAVPNELSNVTFTRVRWSLTFIIYLLTSDADLFTFSHNIRYYCLEKVSNLRLYGYTRFGVAWAQKNCQHKCRRIRKGFLKNFKNQFTFWTIKTKKLIWNLKKKSL